MKFLFYGALALTALLSHPASCYGSNTGDSVADTIRHSPAGILISHLSKNVAEGKTLFGHHDDPVYGHTWLGDSGRSDILETIGAYPAVMSWDLGELESGRRSNLDSVCFERMRAEVIAQDARGGINTFSWHLRNAATGADSWNTTDTLAVSRLLHAPEIKAAFEKQLDRLADFFMSLTDAAGRRIGVIFRPWHEHTGSWFWWGADLCSADDYKELWRRTRTHLDGRGVDNVVYAYSPDRCRDSVQYLQRYPGDDVVDIMGADIYHFGGADGTDRYVADATRTLKIAVREAQRRGKIAAFTETGLESLVMHDWFTRVLQPTLDSVPQVAYVVVWRNASDKPGHFYAPYPGHPAAPHFRQFASNPKIVFVKP